MGRVAHEIRRRLAPEQCVRLEFCTRAQLAAAGFADFESYVASPGAGIPLNDPESAQHVLAELRITKTMPAGRSGVVEACCELPDRRESSLPEV